MARKLDPHKVAKVPLSIRISVSLKNEIETQAKKEGVSVTELLNNLLSKRIAESELYNTRGFGALDTFIEKTSSLVDKPCLLFFYVAEGRKRICIGTIFNWGSYFVQITDTYNGVTIMLLRGFIDNWLPWKDITAASLLALKEQGWEVWDPIYDG